MPDFALSDLDVATRAITLCLDRNIPFVAYSLPDGDEICFASNPSGSSSFDHVFSIRHDGVSTETIGLELDAAATLDRLASIDPLQGCEIMPWHRSTVRTEYLDDISRLTGVLGRDDTKAVISRVLSVSIPGYDNRSWARTSLKIISGSRAAFGYLFFTPATGAWAGATPETLVDVRYPSRDIRTIALAGTRRNDSPRLWDEKNVHEHMFVVDHIVSALKLSGIDATVGARVTVDAGGFEHLMTPITGNLGDADIADVVGRLHPTPAIAGYPVDRALALIDATERHPRRCYGGFIALKTPERYLSHVNLRCFQFAGESACFYGGGGITAKSDPEAEWAETELKIGATLRYLDSPYLPL